ncbi:Rap1 GTPase-GDP dissociation stimulator 1 [Geranomyces variabilis]|uniref:Rap1 GTPase-GDP dissociation stimulator 1 n=1 Tax=Geranomyces variabilis TaxID=109894 RepID=A0AAD5TM16_9FUNG|nr:Rap1 GTPase-GDP dissociation stimulator 1 [Geranomyces variabilis]
MATLDSQLDAARALNGNWTGLASAIYAWAPNSDDSREEFAEWTNGLTFLVDTLTKVSSTAPLDDALRAATAAANVLAEAAKVEDPREPIANAGAIPPLLQLLGVVTAAPQPTEVQNDLAIQLLRALANLCYDHDANRELVLETPAGIVNLVKALKSPAVKVVITACGALTNISMDNEPIQVAVLDQGAVPVLIALLQENIDRPVAQSVTVSASTPAIRVISNLSECDRGIQELLARRHIEILFNLLRYNHQVILQVSVTANRFTTALEVLDALTTVLEAIGENDAVQRALVSRNLLEILLDFVDHRPKIRELEMDDDDVVTYLEIRRAVSRIATLATMNDANMAEITQHGGALIERFKQWMLYGTGGTDVAEEDEIRMSGALAIGNLARSDATCTDLVQRHGVVPPLLGVLKLEIARAKQPGADGKNIIKVVHGAAGALKNLSLAAGNRAVLGSLNIIPQITDLLEVESLKPVHFMSIGIMKNLCAGPQDANVYRLIAGQEPPAGQGHLASWPLPTSSGAKNLTPLGKVVRLMWTATGDNDTGTRNEGGRLIVNLVRACHRGRALPLLKNIVDAQGIVLLLQIVTGALLTRARTDADGHAVGGGEDEHHVHFDALPIEGQVFPVVQNEGVVALVLITDAVPGAIKSIAAYHASLIPTLVNIIASGTEHAKTSTEGTDLQAPHVYADEAKANVCILLRALVAGDDEFRDRLEATTLKSTLLALHASARAPPSADNVSTASVPPIGSSTSPSSASSPSAGQFASVATPMELSRTGTKSARNMGMQGLSRREMEKAFGEVEGGQTEAEPAAEGASLKNVVAGLLLLL